MVVWCDVFRAPVEDHFLRRLDVRGATELSEGGNWEIHVVQGQAQLAEAFGFWSGLSYSNNTTENSNCKYPRSRKIHGEHMNFAH